MTDGLAPGLVALLRATPRRYAPPPLPANAQQARAAAPEVALAFVIERVRAGSAGTAAAAGAAGAAGVAGLPSSSLDSHANAHLHTETETETETETGTGTETETETDLQALFIESLARLIEEALQPDEGDAAFQAMVLRERSPLVREFASLNASADQDRRQWRAGLQAVAHPAKLQRRSPGPLTQALGALQARLQDEDWTTCASATAAAASLAHSAGEPELAVALERLRDAPSLARLARLQALRQRDDVQVHEALMARQGPGAGTPQALTQGNAAQARGDRVERDTAAALHTWADALDRAEGAPGRHRVVTGLLMPATLPGDAFRAKSEWDAALLRRCDAAAPLAGKDVVRDGASSGRPSADPAWELLLLAEAKASPDAAVSDFPRLRKGLQRLGQAEPGQRYLCPSAQGPVALDGASLRAVGTLPPTPDGPVLYGCTAPTHPPPRQLSAASRMQLLSAPESLTWAQRPAGQRAHTRQDLAPLWRRLVEAPGFAAVREQYVQLQRVLALMAHPDDMVLAHGPF